MDGVFFGLAAKKGIMSIILIVVGILLAGLIGLSIPFLTLGDVWSHVQNIFVYQIKNIGPVFAAFPIVWIIGFAVGLWKG